jgi:carboxy-terminal domain RNA polymerase II polypeptide A small phosphatase
MLRHDRKIIVFDLDETLIHATKNRLDIPEDFQYEDYYIYKRPFVHEFLSACARLCPIAIWSSADDDYVSSIAKQLVDNETGLKRKEYQNIKPLEKIKRKGYQMNNLLIIDDSLYKVKDNPNNYFIIEAFVGNQQDQELKYLLSYLEVIIHETNFSTIDHTHWKEKVNPAK